MDTSADFSNVSPQFAAAYRLQPDQMLYVSAGSGFKAGGFNPASPPGSEGYDEEHTWNLEGGWKSTWAGGRVVANAAVFFIDWEDLQLNLPNPFVPAQFYIANVGGATSRGVEFELTARPEAWIDVFGSFGYTRATFKDGTISSGLDVTDNKLPNTPKFTFSAGAQVVRPVTEKVSVYGRGEIASYGEFFYDDLNRASQDAVFAGELPHRRARANWCSGSSGSRTRSTRTTSRWRFRIRASRGSSARTGARGRSASAWE